MATAIRRPQDGTIMLPCPLWALSNHPGRGYTDRMEINVMNRRLCAYDDDIYPQDLFPITPALLDITLHGDGFHVKFNQMRSTNNNFRIGKITVSYERGDCFTFLLSMDDCNIVMGIMRVW
mmetsp:Transcript_31440/g.31920  ORF Transcript_31440/g.31920 Transcript_31440/m.31920 type:complete len:121 (-) Transcript_31440:154-516(-)